jgi:hypothetical protein
MSKQFGISPGRTHCLVHHVSGDGGKRRRMVASLRYPDTFLKIDRARLFAVRLLCVDWLGKRALP